MNNDFLSLCHIFKIAQEKYDVEGQAACITAMLQGNFLSEGNQDADKVRDFLTLHFPVVILAMMECIENHRGRQALFYLQLLPEEKYRTPDMLPSYFYWLGRAFYEQEKWLEAATAFSKRIQEQPDDELANFYLGNCYVKIGEYMRAVLAYQRALTINNQFREATSNRDIVLCGMKESFGAARLIEDKNILWKHLNRDIMPYTKQKANIYDIPIFINSRDRVEPLKKLVSWLCNAGYRNIHIIDNKSTYKPLLLYYEELVSRGIYVWPLNVNYGHKALWESNLLNILQIETPYVYTDSDIVPDDACPRDILFIMAKILGERPYLKKVGLSLHIDDITYYNRAFIQKIEGSMKHVPVKEGYFQSTDTTFALYRNWRHYSLRESVRTADDFMGHHIPWYYDYDNLPADELYYMEHANNSSTQTYFWKKKVSKNN